MESKNSDGFLTWQQACDTISLICGMDFNGLIANGEEFKAACVTILETDIEELPEYWAIPALRIKHAIRELLGIEMAYEDFNSGTRAAILNV